MYTLRCSLGKQSESDSWNVCPQALTDDGVDVPAAVYVGQSVVERRAGLEVVATVDHYVIHDVTRDVTSYMTSL